MRNGDMLVIVMALLSAWGLGREKPDRGRASAGALLIDGFIYVSRSYSLMLSDIGATSAASPDTEEEKPPAPEGMSCMYVGLQIIERRVDQ